jgi:hypothetical protein
LFAFALLFVPSIGRFELSLPAGLVVPYNLKEGDVYPEYSFRFGNLHGVDPTIFQVWRGSVNSPKTFTVTQGARYVFFSIEIGVLEVQRDHIVISVRHLT